MFSSYTPSVIENLLDYRFFVDKANDLHFTGAFGASKRVYLPYLFDTFAPHQLRYSLCLILPNIYDIAVLGSLAFFLHPVPLLLFFSVPAHSI